MKRLLKAAAYMVAAATLFSQSRIVENWAIGYAYAAEDSPRPARSVPREVFEKLSEAIVQVRVLEKVSGVKAAIGSGFFVAGNGMMVTNYHVVSGYVWDRDRYSVDVVGANGTAYPAEVVFLDVVHDLALLKSTATSAKIIAVEPVVPRKGDRVYAMGNPFDLGFTIVEGLYNGLVENSRLERLNFAGSLNPGMSGGPAIDGEGRLVGVNVSTAGNQLSFFVPGKYVRQMLEKSEKLAAAQSDPAASGEAALTGSIDLVRLVEEQLLDDQEQKIGGLMHAPLPTVTLGNHSVPSQLIPSLRCWSANEEHKESRYSYVNHRCATEDTIYVNSQLKVSNLYLFYTRIANDGLNPFSFAALVTSSLKQYDGGSGGIKKDFTNYECVKDFVSKMPSTMWVNLCFRRYKRMPLLFDVSAVGATVDSDSHSLLFYFDLTAVTIENGKKFAQVFLESIVWDGK